MAKTNYSNLEEYEKFYNDSELNSITLIDIALRMKGYNFQNQYDYNTTVVTELGICRSSTMLYDLQNPNKSR